MTNRGSSPGVGDRVITFGIGGAFAERRATRADRAFLLPDGMSFVEAAGWFVPYMTAHHALVDRGNLAKGETLLVLGAAGGVDVVYDPVGGGHFRQAARSTAFLGRILVVGFASGSVPSIGMNVALVKGISLIGVDTGRYICERPSLAAALYAGLVELWENGALDVITSRVLALAELPGVHSRFTDRSVIGKWVVEISRGQESP